MVSTFRSTGAVRWTLAWARPQRPVFVVDREDRDGRACADIEPAGDRQEFRGEMTIGQLGYRDVGRQSPARNAPKAAGTLTNSRSMLTSATVNKL